MSEHECTEKDFLKCVEKHRIIVIRDDGIYRHIRFKAPGTCNQFFDLTTWPGYLCYSGDMGTYVFQRMEDMFQFFRGSKNEPFINPRYWGEKLEAVGEQSGFKKFSADAFRERVQDHFKMYCEDNELKGEEIAAIQSEIDDEILCYLDGDFDEEYRAARLVQEFRSTEREDFYFMDFFDGGGTNEYTYRYIWACCAIVWGISKYDEIKEALKVKNPNDDFVGVSG